jgi:hypothetical protein
MADQGLTTNLRRDGSAAIQDVVGQSPPAGTQLRPGRRRRAAVRLAAAPLPTLGALCELKLQRENSRGSRLTEVSWLATVSSH